MKGPAEVCAYASVLLMLSVLYMEDVAAQQKGIHPSFLGMFGEALHSTGTNERERIETDRHDFTQSTKTVGRGVFQIEGGYSFFYRSEEGETEHLSMFLVCSFIVSCSHALLLVLDNSVCQSCSCFSCRPLAGSCRAMHKLLFVSNVCLLFIGMRLQTL